MTLLEKAKELGLTIIEHGYSEYAEGCPVENGLPSGDTQEEEDVYCEDHTCMECYARECKEPTTKETSEAEPMRHFDTGAVRDSAAGKGRFDLLPWGAIHALAKHCQRGAEHYGPRNVDKGINQSSLLDSAVRHVALYIQGDAEDYHLVAALWNIAWACEQEIKRPEMVDLPERNEHSGKAV